MATGAIMRLAEREEGVTFSAHQDARNTQSYQHYDGEPENIGVSLEE